MTDDREPFREARAAGLKARQERRLENATYTAAEVKVLTAKAREEAAERIAQAIEGARIERHWNIVALAAAGECASIAREIGSKESA